MNGQGSIIIKNVSKYSLKSGKSKSCGCLQKESSKKLRKPLPNGTKYGKLTVIGIDEEKYKSHRETWHICKCECGNVFSFPRSALVRGHTKSCGCGKLHSSMWELNICQKIEDLLKHKSICRYQKAGVKQMKLKDLNGKYFFYDLLIEPFNSNRKIIIECNGTAFHPKQPDQKKPDGTEWKNAFTKESSSEKYKKDMIKKQLAESNGYEIYYIWDDESDEVNIDYILSLI